MDVRFGPFPLDAPVADAWLEDAALGRLRWLQRTPYAHTVCARRGQGYIGVGGVIEHGSSWRIDLLETHPILQHAPIANAMMHALLTEADARGIAAQIAYRPASEIAFWQALGFHPAGELHTYSGGRFLNAQSDLVVHAAPEHWLTITHLDRQATGEDRDRWLREHDFLNSVFVERRRVRGFLMSLLRNALIVADSPEVGLELQRWQFPLQEHLIVPAANTAAVEHLSERGYRNTATIIRYVRGQAPDWRPARLFAMP